MASVSWPLCAPPIGTCTSPVSVRGSHMLPLLHIGVVSEGIVVTSDVFEVGCGGDSKFNAEHKWSLVNGSLQPVTLR